MLIGQTVGIETASITMSWTAGGPWAVPSDGWSTYYTRAAPTIVGLQEIRRDVHNLIADFIEARNKHAAQMAYLARAMRPRRRPAPRPELPCGVRPQPIACARHLSPRRSARKPSWRTLRRARRAPRRPVVV